MTTRKTNGAGGLRWPTIVAFLALFVPILTHVGQQLVLSARLKDHIEAATKTTKEIKADLKSHDVRIRENSNGIARLEPRAENGK